MSIATVRTNMATALRTISGLRASEYLTETVNPPHAMLDYEVEPDLTFARGADVYRFTVTVFANRSSSEASQKLLDLYRDPTSSSGVKYVLENDATLAAVVDYVRVTRIGKVELVPVGSVEYLAVNFDAEVVI
jgi:hypothetical protein